MLHTYVSSIDRFTAADSGLAVAAVNSRCPTDSGAPRLHVTLCGAESAVSSWLGSDENAVPMRPRHPWHHPSYKALVSESDLSALSLAADRGPVSADSCRFVSATAAGEKVGALDAEHWLAWLSTSVDFVAAVDWISQSVLQDARPLLIIEIGAHPVLAGMFLQLPAVLQISSMCREQNSIDWMLQQRSAIGQVAGHLFMEALSQLEVRQGSGHTKLARLDAPFAAQGFTSVQYPALASDLAPFFPRLTPMDLYRFPSIKDLAAGYGSMTSPTFYSSRSTSQHALVLSIGLLLPPAVTTCEQLWTALLHETKAVHRVAGKKYAGGYLDEQAFNARQEAVGLGIEPSEFSVMDRQHILALVLAGRCFDDAGPEVLAEAVSSPDRCGVYIGAWQEPPRTESPSAYRVLGTSLSAMAAKVANKYNLQGPALTINTACSSGLVAVHAAMHDLRAGVVDFALVGSVNLLSDEALTEDLARAHFLSPTGCCHTFSAEADGYVRSEGGVMLLLCLDDGQRPCRAILRGSATNQNSQRRPLTAVDPVAQERVIRAACADAGVQPSQIAVVECHGTGTKLGDPVEVSALASTVGSNRAAGSLCHLTAAKMTFGHLESAAGGLGLVKAVLMAEQLLVPGATVEAVSGHVNVAMEGASLQLPCKSPVKLPVEVVIGVSSFGFTGNNAHVIVQAVPSGRRRPSSCDAVKPRTETASAQSASSLANGLSKVEKLAANEHKVERSEKSEKSKTSAIPQDGAIPQRDALKAVQLKVWEVCDRVCQGISEGNRSDANIFELGMDSLGLAELFIQLETAFHGTSLTVDEVMDDPTVDAIATLIFHKGTAVEGHSKSLATAASLEVPEPVEDGEPADVPALRILGVFDSAAMPSVHMPSGNDHWVRTTHVGSLPRSAQGMETIVAQQLGLGIDWINDGEWTRENYISDMLSRLTCIGGNSRTEGKCMCNMPCAADMYDAPMFARRFTGGNGLITLNPARVAQADVACTGPILYTNSESLTACLQPFLDAIGSRDRASCFWFVPSPGVLAVFCEDRFYRDQVLFTMALAEAVRHEYEAVASTGLVLQVDAPDLAMGRHTKHAALSEEEFKEVIRCNVDAINFALANIDPSMVRVHVCWGNYPGPHHRDLDVRHIWPQLLRLRARYISTEGANPRHAHDWEYFGKHVASKFIEADKVLLVGVLDTRSAHVEHPELVAQRILQYVKVLGPGRVVASTDCGFATTAKSTSITEDIAWLKLKALVEGAKLAQKQLLNLGAPQPTSTIYSPTGFRVVFIGDVETSASALLTELSRCAWSLDVMPATTSATKFHEQLKYMVDAPIAIVAFAPGSAELASQGVELLQKDLHISRRPLTIFSFEAVAGTVQLKQTQAAAAAAAVQQQMQDAMRFDKRQLVPSAALLAPPQPPSEVDVVIIGAGLLGLYAAVQLQRRGFRVAVLEQRLLVGGIWSMYANSHSQVNSSEGGYSLKDILGESGANRDHSTAREIITDIAKLAKEVDGSIHCGVRVVRVMKLAKGYSTISHTDHRGTHITESRAVLLAINDRVGIPRQCQLPGENCFKGIVTTGTNDNLANVDSRGKRVIIIGMGAFAIENARTALEHGADHVTVLVRRHGTVCPKIIDYLNFVKPFKADFQHDTTTNIKQMLQWSALYRKSGATIPECWPEEIKHEGHTISVSDLWFVGHHMGKLSTKVASVERLATDSVHLSDGSSIEADIVISCIGFARNTVLCEELTGCDSIKNTNYLDKQLMYLADAEIDHGAFNWFFGSSVLEYAKFFTEVFITGLEHEDEVSDLLWGPDLPTCRIQDRKWSHSIASSASLIRSAHSEGPKYFAQAAQEQVHRRQRHFYSTLPPEVYVKANQLEWEELHTRLNGGVPVPAERQLPYFFKDAASWCEAGL